MEPIMIGICDDQPEAVSQLRRYIDDFLQKSLIEREIRSFFSGAALLEEIEKLKIVFLDIEMPDMDGIRTGKEIVKRNPQCRVIMATGIVERFKEAFQINALRFVTKPFLKEEVEEALKAALETEPGGQLIELFFKRAAFSIPQSRILYVRAINGYTEYWVEERWSRREITLEEAEKLLDDRIFTRVSRQFLVNLAYVENYAGGVFQLEGIRFQVSRRLRRQFERKLMEYDVRYRRGGGM